MLSHYSSGFIPPGRVHIRQIWRREAAPKDCFVDLPRCAGASETPLQTPLHKLDRGGTGEYTLLRVRL